MNDVLEYEEFGEIHRSAPLETFYEAMLPQLKNYGLTAQFPADIRSLAYDSTYGSKHDVLIGELPNAVRYLKWQASSYSLGGSELTLESEMLVHKITGGKLAFKIFISDSIAGMPHAAGNFNLILKFRGEKSEVEALRKAIAPVLEKYNFRSHEVKKSLIITDNLEEKSNKNSNSELMTNNVNFDELAQKSFAPGAAEADYERLFAAAFLLSEWHFIAVGEMPNLSPYCALFPDFFGDQPAVAVFTDTERARKFMAESNTEFGSKNKPINLNYGDLTATLSSENLILSVPTGNILDYIEKLIPKGIVKIFFNPNTDSHGFSNDLKIMRPIREHLESKNMLSKTAVENSPNQISKLIEENAETIADFERENALLSSMIAGSAAAMDEKSDEEKEQVISNMADMFESVRVEYNMSPKLFRVFIETCLKRRKFLMPTLAFAYFQEDKNGIEKLEQDKELSADLAKWLIKKAVPGADLLLNETEKESVIIPEKEADEPINVNKNEPEKSDASAAPFDELSKKAMETNAMEDLSALFGAAFALPEWHFIARGELPNVAPYVASNAAVADNQPMIRAFTDTKRLMRFAHENNLTEADGSAKMLTIPTENIIPYLEGFIPDGAFGVWFNSDSESKDFYIPIKQLQPIKGHLAKLNQPPPSNLQNWGLAETPDGEIDLNLTINKVGTVSFETSIAPFYEAIVPLLKDYQGTGDYMSLLRFEESGKSEQVENIAENSHGAYLQIRRFLYLNPKNNTRIGVNSIHSKSLRHVQTNAELLVSFELCKNLDNQTGVFYHAFQGPKSEILKLSAAIQPLLEASGYQAVS